MLHRRPIAAVEMGKGHGDNMKQLQEQKSARRRSRAVGQLVKNLRGMHGAHWRTAVEGRPLCVIVVEEFGGFRFDARPLRPQLLQQHRRAARKLRTYKVDTLRISVAGRICAPPAQDISTDDWILPCGCRFLQPCARHGARC